jgi:uncharacterized membrane protein YeaQ/YmgE (transglycosylase-associated protein family)
MPSTQYSESDGTVRTVEGIVLGVHVAAGSVGLLLGPYLMLTAKRRGPHTRLGTVYHWVFVALFVSAVGLAIINPDVWWLAIVGAFSYAFALLGFAAGKRRWRGWLVHHVAGQGGSYIAMTTALLVVNLGRTTALAWIVPTVVGSPLLVWLTNEIEAGRRPKRRVPATLAR